jgi:hypothetical protein
MVLKGTVPPVQITKGILFKSPWVGQMVPDIKKYSIMPLI